MLEDGVRLDADLALVLEAAVFRKAASSFGVEIVAVTIVGPTVDTGLCSARPLGGTKEPARRVAV